MIFLDIMMPDIDGYEVCQTLKKDPRFNDTKIIFLSAKSKKEDIEKGLQMGADKYFTKPFSTKQLLQEMVDLMQG
jgi:CheY-like chemotaxis protein